MKLDRSSITGDRDIDDDRPTPAGPERRGPVFLRRLPKRAIAVTGGLVASGAIFQASLFLTTVLVARTLGTAELGHYAVAHAIGAIFVSGLGSGIPILALRETAADGLSRPFLAKILQTELLVTSAGTIAAAGVGWIVLGGPRGLGLGVLAGTAYVTLTHLSLLSAVHAGMHRYRSAALARAGCGCMVVVLTFAALSAGLGIGGALGGLAVAGGVSAGWLLWSARQHASIDGGPDTSSLFARSRPFVGLGLVSGGYQRIDALVVLIVTSASVAGIYASAYRTLSPFILLATGFGTVFLSKLSSTREPDARWHRVRRRGTRLFAATILPLAALAFLAMPQLITWFYGPQFSSAITPARILLLSIVPYALYLPNAHALNAAGQERHLLGVLATSLALEVVLMVVLSHAYGAAGAAWAWLLTELLVLIGVSRTMRSRCPLPVSAASRP